MNSDVLHQRLHGVLPAAVTPMQSDGELDLDGLAINIRIWRQLGLSGYLILGSTGEQPLLSELERMLVVETARREIPSDQLMIVGTGFQSTRATIEFTRQAAEVGADAVLVVTPNYYLPTLTVEAFVNHYTAIAEASPVPVLLYSVPPLTGVTLPVEAVARLAEHPNIVGMKDSSGQPSYLHAVRNRVPADFALFSGSAVYSLGALADGTADGLILAVANVVPELCVELVDAVGTGDLQRARAVHRKIIALNHVVAPYGVGGFKVAMEARGWRGGPPRSPLRPPDQQAIPRIRHIVEQVTTAFSPAASKQ